LGGNFGKLCEPAIPARRQAGGGQKLRRSWREQKHYLKIPKKTFSGFNN